MTSAGTRIGIEALNPYCGVARISARTLFAERGLDMSRFDNLMTEQRSVQMPWEDPVTNAVNAARPLVEALGDTGRQDIELLITSTESGLDYSKSVASYVHEHLNLSRECRILEVKQACYAATGALQLSAGYLAAGTNRRAKALIVATDVNPMDERARYAEPTTGHGAVALLVGHEPEVLALDPGAYGIYGFDVMDTARPLPDLDLYHTDLSLLTYLDCLMGSYRSYRRRVGAGDLVDSFDHLVMHTPFGGMVRAAHRKMMREFAPRPPKAIAADFQRRVRPSLTYAQDVGNLCSGSIYLALASLVDSAAPAAVDGARIGLFAFGSGCASEFFSGVLDSRARARIGRLDIPGRLARRRELSFKEYTRLIPLARTCLVPRQHHVVDLAGCEEVLEPFRGSGPFLVLDAVDNYRRTYAWR